MEPTHYCDVMIKMPEVAREIHARIITIVHSVIAKEHRLGVTWPDWKSMPGQFGYLCRVFGDENSVKILVNALSPLIHKELIRTFPIAQVPVVTNRIVFKRDRTIDKFSPCVSRRLKLRADGRGDTYIPKPKPDMKSHSLRIQSGSTGQEFSIFVKRESSSKDHLGGHEYGLGFALPDF